MNKIGSITDYSASNVKALLSNAKCGDVLQFAQNSAGTDKQHSMIVYSVESDGVMIYDCNWFKDTISLRKVSFGAWSGRESTQLTLLRSDNYSLIDGESSNTCTCSTNYAGTYICTTTSSDLRIRSGHGTGYSILGGIPPGTVVTVSKASGTGDSDWAHVTYNGITGYVSMQYLSLQQPSQERDVRIDLWLSDSIMGNSIDSVRTGEWLYFCYKIYDANTGELYDTFKSFGDYSVKLTLYGPDGSVQHTCTYTSDYNYIGITRSTPGEYTGELVITANNTGASVSGQVSVNMVYEPRVTPSESDISLSVTGTVSKTLIVSYSGATNSDYIYVDCLTSGNCFSYQWGSWDNGQKPLTITGVRAGEGTITIRLRDYDTDEILATSTVYVKVDAPTYTVSYDANGGTGAPSSQTKYYNTTLTLSSTTPTRTGYTFLGWSTNSTATIAAYQPGGSFTSNSSTTLYAVWEFYKYAVVNGTCGDNLTWTLYEDGELVISGTGAMTNWASASDVPWYNYREQIITATIEPGVTSIDSHAFYECTSLTSVTIPDSVKKIGYYAFSYCKSLTSVTIPDSVTSIGSGAFGGCTSLASIAVDENNEYYSSDVYGVLFNKNKTILIQYPVGNTRTQYTIPDSVTSIGSFAFDVCTGLTSVTIPDSVTSIGSYAFYGCTGLTSVTIPDSVTSIGSYAFYGCTGLTSVTIPDSVTSIGDYAFDWCKSLTKATIYSTNATFGSSVFFGAHSDFEIHGYSGSTAETYANANGHTFVALDGSRFTDVLPGNQYLEAINDISAKGIMRGTTDTIFTPDAYVTRYQMALFMARATTGEVDDDTVWQNGIVPFADVTEYKGAIQYVYLNGIMNGRNETTFEPYGNVAYIEALTIALRALGYDGFEYPWGFYNKAVELGLTANVAVDNLYTTLNRAEIAQVLYNMIYACRANSNLTFAEQNFDDEPIANGTYGDNLTWTLYNNGLLVISGTGAMTNWDSSLSAPWYDYREQIKIAYIGNGVTTIGNRAFYGCTNLVSVTISDSVLTLGDNAFYGCTNLSFVCLGDGLTSIGGYAFASCTSLTSLELPPTLTTICERAFDNSALVNIDIPNGVTEIGEYAFRGSDLEYITIPQSVNNIGDGAFYWCSNLKSITVDSNNLNFSSDEYGVLFNKDKTTLIQYPSDSDEISYHVPESVTTIGEGAFVLCGLKEVSLPIGLTTIDAKAFYRCERLNSIIIPDGVTANIGIGSAVIDATFDTSYSSAINFRGLGSGVNSYDTDWNYSCEADVYLMYDSEYLYIFANVTDDDVLTKGPVYCSGNNPYKNDCIEFYLDLDGETGNGACKFGIDAYGFGVFGLEDDYDLIDYSLLEYSTALTDTGYAVEIAIPINKGFANVIEAGKIGFAYRLNDITKSGSHTYFTSSFDGEEPCVPVFFDINESILAIGKWAFGGCTNLTNVTIYSRNAVFSSEVFKNVTEGFTIYGYAGSTAETYANANGHTFVALVDISDAITSIMTVPTSATVTPHAGGWIKGENTFTVACERTCYVFVSNDGGDTYERLTATANASGGYDFTATLTAESEIVVRLAGDISGNGALAENDFTVAKKMLLDVNYRNDPLTRALLDTNGDGRITVNEITLVRRALLGLEIAW